MPRPIINWLTVCTYDADRTKQHIINHDNDPGAACCAVDRMLAQRDANGQHEFVFVLTVVQRTAPDGSVSTWAANSGGGWFEIAKGERVCRVSPTLVQRYISFFC